MVSTEARTWHRPALTLLFCVTYPFMMYWGLSTVLTAGWERLSPPALLVMTGVGAVGCGAAWLITRPIITWTRVPLWWYLPVLGALLIMDRLLWSPERTAGGLLFSLILIGFSEEFIFRGCVEQGLSRLGPKASIIVTGAFFGIGHAPLSMLISGTPAHVAILSAIGGGIVGHLLFRFLRDRGGLLFPILVHGFSNLYGS